MSMEYKGYTASISFDAKARLFIGQLAGIRDCILFQGSNADELLQDFQGAVDEYLQTCAEMGKAPDKPASGNIMARIAPIVHGAAIAAAERAGRPLNQWLEALIARECGVAL